MIENVKDRSLTNYIEDAKQFPLIPREKEKELAIAVLNGDKKSGEELVKANLLLVVKIAHEYSPAFNNLNDLIQEGNIGLLRSVDKYNPEKGYRFSTYAGWWIRSMMLRYIFNNSHMIKPGSTNEQKKLFYNLRKEQKRLEYLGIDANTETIAKNLNVSEADVSEMNVRLCSDVYLDSPILLDDDGDRTIYDCIITPAEEQPDKKVENSDFLDMLKSKISMFASKLKDDRQRVILFKRIIAEDKSTLQEIGDKFGITKERVRQIEEELIEKLKKHFRNIETYD